MNFEEPDDYNQQASVYSLDRPILSALQRRNALRHRTMHMSSIRRAARPQHHTSRYPLSQLVTPSPPPRSPSEEPARKRRRMVKGPQRNPEEIPMELRHCDGGRYEGGVGYRDYSPECALRNDESVYCTKNKTCNMILRHRDNACFSITKIIIRAPNIGYNAPVRAGMVFIVMNDTDLLAKTDYSFKYDANPESDTSLQFVKRDEEEPDDLSNYSTDTEWPSEINKPPPLELLEPHAKFVHSDTSECTEHVLDFTTPIEGKYILLKFFAAKEHANIDIQYIGAIGYVGRRVFPAITMR
ncbi:hypothetical protein FPQ18DRAFT_355474 [Pyronema domesticum]|nr:hypothetical protein FPQ18DRAFT_355474 [Pyronema domesticum]